jgi:hypothetical protein
MRRIFLALVLPLSLLLVAPATPAQAASVSFTDPAGDSDSAGSRLDILGVVLDNRDHRIVIETSYVRVSRGRLSVFLRARNTEGRRFHVVSLHHPNVQQDHNFLVDGKAGKEEVVPCAGLRVTWSAEADTSRISLPSKCFHNGNYGAVRIPFMFADADQAPDQRSQAEWVARG